MRKGSEMQGIGCREGRISVCAYHICLLLRPVLLAVDCWLAVLCFLYLTLFSPSLLLPLPSLARCLPLSPLPPPP